MRLAPRPLPDPSASPPAGVTLLRCSDGALGVQPAEEDSIANLVLATVDDSLKRTVDVGSERVAAVVGHKYGPEAGRSAQLATHTARNVTLVYIDMRGFGRKALIKKAGTTWIKARMGGGKEMSGLVVDKQADQGGPSQSRKH